MTKNEVLLNDLMIQAEKCLQELNYCKSDHQNLQVNLATFQRLCTKRRPTTIFKRNSEWVS